VGLEHASLGCASVFVVHVVVAARLYGGIGMYLEVKGSHLTCIICSFTGGQMLHPLMLRLL